MPSKTEEYLALAQRTANGLTRYWESWTDYLTTASRLYKYPFADQLMIYAQRPDATACADYDIWNNRMNRYVRRGSKGIALLDESSGFPRLHYVFDVSDTGVRRNSRDPEVWQFNDDLSEDEYAAARSSTLNAHYTSPVVIRSIYDAVEKIGFQSGNILEPSMGAGNFFGMLPTSMADSRLYGVELDSITGRIAKKLYPQADITVAGFETTDRRDFYDLAVGNVPFGQYKVNDKAYNKLGFSMDFRYTYKKSAEDIFPKWEESSAVFVYRFCAFSMMSFSSAKNRSTFFRARTSSCISFRALR